MNSMIKILLNRIGLFWSQPLRSLESSETMLHGVETSSQENSGLWS